MTPNHSHYQPRTTPKLPHPFRGGSSESKSYHATAYATDATAFASEQWSISTNPARGTAWRAWALGSSAGSPAPCQRREVVASLRDQGLSLRAIASATGNSVNTVRAALDQVYQSDTPANDVAPQVRPSEFYDYQEESGVSGCDQHVTSVVGGQQSRGVWRAFPIANRRGDRQSAELQVEVFESRDRHLAAQRSTGGGTCAADRDEVTVADDDGLAVGKVDQPECRRLMCGFVELDDLACGHRGPQLRSEFVSSAVLHLNDVRAVSEVHVDRHVRDCAA